MLLAQHPIPDPHVSLNVFRVGRVFFNLFAQGGHKYPQGGYIPLPGASPDFFGNVGVGQYLAYILGKKTEKLVFVGG